MISSRLGQKGMHLWWRYIVHKINIQKQIATDSCFLKKFTFSFMGINCEIVLLEGDR